MTVLVERLLGKAISREGNVGSILLKTKDHFGGAPPWRYHTRTKGAIYWKLHLTKKLSKDRSLGHSLCTGDVQEHPEQREQKASDVVLFMFVFSKTSHEH